MPFVARVQNIGQRRLAGCGAQSAHLVHSPINLRLTKIAFGNQTRNGSTVPPYHDGLAALDGGQQFRQPRFGVGRLHFAH